ncbi:MAG: beta-ketoacyl-[acyl-carrier-protein] synthase family protein [Deltaproteobacteria bacterium]|nr:beta-ketoacyl-[acyl-carrier-protein] synthase family protein [Deltaproteobacteria bacterium]
MAGGHVAITGMGLVSALGAGVAESLDVLFSGRTSGPDSSPLPTDVAHPPPAFRVRASLEPDDELTRTSSLALAAVREAVAQSGLDLPGRDPLRTGVVLGTTVGCSFNAEAFYRSYRDGDGPDLGAVERYLRNALAPLVAGRIGAKGPSITVVNACASGTDAIGIGASLIRAGTCDVVVAGGADELERFAYHGFLSLKNVSTRACRPFDRGRDGLNLGEGAGVVVLERTPSSPVLGRVLGYASASDAHHPTTPHPGGRGLRRAIGAALDAAGLRPDEVAFVNAHGTATIENDRVEGSVLADLFAPGLPVVSTKGWTGHTLGAAGAIEAVLALCGLRDGRIPPTAGHEEPDPECGVTPTRETTPITAGAALSTSLAFGGMNAALVIGGP